ncbi:MAG TPA: hypothetical protein VMA75_04000 [Candidatus Paceibacterota bacterium]|nr:hypothetical protein [Candidatus Paceibacterota bacterium]
MEELEVLEEFEKKWDTCPKNQVMEFLVPGMRQCFGFAYETSLRVWAGLAIGERSGIYEFLTVVDPTKKILIDQLVMNEITNAEGFLFDLASVRREVHSGGDPLAVCRRHITRVLARANADPADFTRQVQRAAMPSRPRRSVSFLRIVPGCYGSRQ